MDDFKAYRDRVKPKGMTFQEDMYSSTKRQAYDAFMSSPTLSNVTLNDEKNTRLSIVSDMETFNKRRFLFLPDSVVNVGDYIKHKDMTYLATNEKKIEIYPELFGEVCNQTFPLARGRTKIDTGKKNDFGRPILDYIEDIVHLPCVMTDQVYSALSNAAIPLPTGAMIMKIPYDVDHKVEVNYEIKVYDSEYQVTETSYEHVINEVGYVEVYLQRKTGGNTLGN